MSGRTLVCVPELKEEVVYYDVCEDQEELQSMVHTGPQHGDSAAVHQHRRHLHSLEAKRGAICARRAYLRSKKVWARTNLKTVSCKLAFLANTKLGLRYYWLTRFFWA